MELLQRLAFDDLPVPDIPEPPEMEQRLGCLRLGFRVWV